MWRAGCLRTFRTLASPKLEYLSDQIVNAKGHPLLILAPRKDTSTHLEPTTTYREGLFSLIQPLKPKVPYFIPS